MGIAALSIWESTFNGVRSNSLSTLSYCQCRVSHEDCYPELFLECRALKLHREQNCCVKDIINDFPDEADIIDVTSKHGIAPPGLFTKLAENDSAALRVAF